MLSRLSAHVRHNVVGYLALFFALTGVAYAAGPLKAGDPAGGDLTGTYPNPTIAAGAVTGGSGGKVADNTLTGDDVNEASLGKVGDADTLDGLNSSFFTANRLIPTTVTLDFPSIDPQACARRDVSVFGTGSDGDQVLVSTPFSFPLLLQASPVFDVLGDNVTRVHLCNLGTIALDPGPVQQTLLVVDTAED